MESILLNQLDDNPLIERIVQVSQGYQRHAFMYIEYPHKSFWSPDFGAEDACISHLSHGNRWSPTLLYVHVPHCKQQCLFCTCHTVITHNYERVKAYLKDLLQEIELYYRSFTERGIDPNIVEIHLGGGTPSLLQKPEFEALLAKLTLLAPVKQLREFAIEIDPRHITPAMLQYYHDCGINRISLGVQEFDPEIQHAINRVQPRELIDPIMSPEVRRLFPHGINFDILCGLPNQTPEKIRRTFEIIMEMMPDRICLNHLHYAPDVAPYQRVMLDGRKGRPNRLPNQTEKKVLFREAMKILAAHGYVRTGYEHFARPDDGVAQALESEQMHWNSLGVTTGDYRNILGVGVHSTSTLPEVYYQNTYGVEEYAEQVGRGELPIYRGVRLSQDDLIRRDVILSLRNFFKVEFTEIEAKYHLSFTSTFARELASLDQAVQEGLVELSSDRLEVTEVGKDFVLFLCQHFDAYA